MSPINSQSRNTNSNNDTGGGSLLRNLRNRKSEDPITNRTNKTFDQQRHIEKAFKGLSLTLGRKRPEIPSQGKIKINTIIFFNFFLIIFLFFIFLVKYLSSH